MADIYVADDVFALVNPDDPDGPTNPAVVVVSDTPELAARALARARKRFWLVDDSGVEHPDLKAVEEHCHRHPTVAYPPSFVSPVLVGLQGPLMWVDADDQIPRPMAARFVQILVEELNAGGVSRARIVNADLNEETKSSPHEEARLLDAQGKTVTFGIQSEWPGLPECD